MTGEPPTTPEVLAPQRQALPGPRAPGRCRRATRRRAARSPRPAGRPRGPGAGGSAAAGPRSNSRPSSRAIRRPPRTPAPGSPAGSPSVQGRTRPGEPAASATAPAVVGVHDDPVAGRLERDDARLGLEVGREAAVLVDVVGPDVRDAGDVRTGGADGEVIRRELGHAQRRRAGGEHTLEQRGGRPGVVGRRVARAQRLDAARAQHRLGEARRRRLAGAARHAQHRHGREAQQQVGGAGDRGRVAELDGGSGVQGESSRTSSPTPSRAREHAQRGELGLLAGRHRRAHAGGPESSSREQHERPAQDRRHGTAVLALVGGDAARSPSRPPARRPRRRAPWTRPSEMAPMIGGRRRAASSHSARRSSRWAKLARSRARRRTWIESRSAVPVAPLDDLELGAGAAPQRTPADARAAPSAGPRRRARWRARAPRCG